MSLATFTQTEQQLYHNTHAIIHRVMNRNELCVVNSSGFITPRENEPLLAIVPLTAKVLAALGLSSPAVAPAPRPTIPDESAEVEAKTHRRRTAEKHRRRPPDA